MVVRVVIMGVIGMSCGDCHFMILPAVFGRDGPRPLLPCADLNAYGAVSAAEAKLLPGVFANFFFAVSTQATNS